VLAAGFDVTRPDALVLLMGVDATRRDELGNAGRGRRDRVDG